MKAHAAFNVQQVQRLTRQSDDELHASHYIESLTLESTRRVKIAEKCFRSFSSHNKKICYDESSQSQLKSRLSARCSYLFVLTVWRESSKVKATKWTEASLTRQRNFRMFSEALFEAKISLKCKRKSHWSRWASPSVIFGFHVRCSMRIQM